MRTIKRKYKTFEGFFRSYKGQLRVEDFFGDRMWYHDGRFIKAELPEEEINRVAEKVAKYVYPTVWKQKVSALASGRGDLHCFHCFFVNFRHGEIEIDNSLSGEAFKYCKRKYSRSI